MRTRFVLGLVAVVSMALVTPASADVSYGDTGSEVKTVQEDLAALGYSVPVTGFFGPVTQKAVVKWQRANGLVQDGIVGPVTLASLEGAADVSQVAVRVNPPTSEYGLRGMPLAPEGLTLCQETEFYRAQTTLSMRFSPFYSDQHSRWVASDGIGWREAKCDNTPDADNPNGSDCCLGYYQTTRAAINNRVYGPYLHEFCEISSVWDYYGDSGLAKQKATCMAEIMNKISGLQPWSPT